MKSVKDFNRSFPSRQEFYNDLTEEEVNEKAYIHGEKIWKEMECKDMGQYHDIYVKLDVALLADIMREVREILFTKYELDMYQYFSIPMFSFDCMLKFTKVKLEYIKDPTIHLFFEQSIRGGYCGPASVRMAKANNKFMGDDYDANKPSSYILYLDANNLCKNFYTCLSPKNRIIFLKKQIFYSDGKAMSEPLPVGGFEFVEGEALKEIQTLKEDFVKKLSKTSEYGYTFEVDLTIPKHLEEKFSDFPPCPAKRTIRKDELSTSYQIPLQKELDINDSVLTSEKLIADLYDKENYTVHFSVLQKYISLGVQIKRVKNVVKFRQERFLKKYIDQNTIFRNLPGTTEFERDFWKLMNNSVFGKMIENVRNRQKVRIVLTQEYCSKLVKLPTMQFIEIINNDLAIVSLKKSSVYLDRPIYVGCAILDYAKEIMYDFHYNFTVPTYGKNAKLVYTGKMFAV